MGRFSGCEEFVERVRQCARSEHGNVNRCQADLQELIKCQKEIGVGNRDQDHNHSRIQKQDPSSASRDSNPHPYIGPNKAAGQDKQAQERDARIPKPKREDTGLRALLEKARRPERSSSTSAPSTAAPPNDHPNNPLNRNHHRRELSNSNSNSQDPTQRKVKEYHVRINIRPISRTDIEKSVNQTKAFVQRILQKQYNACKVTAKQLVNPDTRKNMYKFGQKVVERSKLQLRQIRDFVMRLDIRERKP